MTLSADRVEIEIVLSARPLERVESDIAVAGFFLDERPLRGGAARADWRLCGGLSRRIAVGDLSGKSGEAMLIGCGRALRSPRLLLLGLGERHRYDRLRVTDETREALDRCRRLQLRRVALAPLGIAPDDVPRHASAIVAGVIDAWHLGDSSEDAPRILDLCVPKSEIVGVHRALESACEAAGATGIRVTAESA